MIWQLTVGWEQEKLKPITTDQKEIIWTDSTTGSVVGKVTIVERGDGTTKITWKEQAARIGNAATENENDKGWNASFGFRRKTTSLVET